MYLRRRRLCPNNELRLASPEQRAGHVRPLLYLMISRWHRNGIDVNKANNRGDTALLKAEFDLKARYMKRP